MIVVDSSVWIGYFNKLDSEHTVWLNERMGRITIALTDIILMEVLQGIRIDAVFHKVLKSFDECEILETCGQELAIAAAHNYRLLRDRGFTVRKPVDCIIATLCLRDNHSLLHRDRDFDPFEQHLGLKVIHPTRH